MITISDQFKRVIRLARLIIPAIQFGGGPFGTIRKAIRIYYRHGLAGIKGELIKAADFKQGNWVRRQNDILHARIPNPLFCFHPAPQIPEIETRRPVDVIIPVYNGSDYLKALLSSIACSTTRVPYRIILVDDCSFDTAISDHIKSFVDAHPEIPIVCIRNKKNLGFVKSVNRALMKVKNHFVLLNTDVEVPDFWLERLMYPIFEMDRVATTTPFTNSGTICSFPAYLEDNELYEELSVDELDSYFRHVKFDDTYIQIPTGIGFCMGVNRDVVKKIGAFDESFGRGYGEENDWCQRAIKAEYRNIHVTNLFVYHAHGGSFDAHEKQGLETQNMEILLGKHPDYLEQVTATAERNAFNALRRAMEFKILSTLYHAELVLDHNLGGGATDYLNRTIDSQLLPAQKLVFVVRYVEERKLFTLHAQHASKGWLPGWHFESLDGLERIIREFNVKHLFINELVSYPDVLEILHRIVELKKERNFNLTIPVHDYFCLCASYNLLNGQNTYCGVPEYKDCDRCWKSNAYVKHVTETQDVAQWREAWGRLFESSDEILCFSNASVAILEKAYPQVNKEKIHCLPHKVDYLQGVKESITGTGSAGMFRIGVIGIIALHKGLHVIREMADLIESRNLNMEIIIVGYPYETFEHSKVHVTGRYDKSELPALIAEHNIDVILIPSIWPETFSYTTEEAMHMGLPVAVFNIGAPAERVAHYEKGIIIEEISAESALDSIMEWERLRYGEKEQTLC